MPVRLAKALEVSAGGANSANDAQAAKNTTSTAMNATSTVPG
jgi:hypothetical protein